MGLLKAKIIQVTDNILKQEENKEVKDAL